MRQRWSTMGVLILVIAIMALGLAGCAREAPGRESEPTEAADRGATMPSDGTEVAAAGETVVSAVTPTESSPGGQTQPTLVPVGGTPAAGETAEAAPTGEAEATPPPADSQPPGTTTDAIWHTVQPGETLSSIARRYGTTWQDIAEANNIINPNHVDVGQKLKIPTSGGSSGGTTSGCRIQHTVRQGEWVWQIARNYGVDPYDILAANGLTVQSANTIYAGMVLCIP
jgi:LysM repeat protein